MASITTQFREGTDGFVFVNNPMVVRVVPSSIPEGATFPQVMVETTTQMIGVTRTHQFAVSITNDQSEVMIDIASAVRSVMAQYQYEPGVPSPTASVIYPCATFTVEAWERYMDKDGLVVESNHTTPIYGAAFLGGLSDYEIWKSGENQYPTGEDVSFTTKPEGETFGDDQLRCESMFTPGSPGSVKTTFSVQEGGVVDHRNRITMLFVNSRGVFETISVITREAKEYELSSEVMNLGSTPSYVPKAGLSTHKTLGPAMWKMSSGYINRDWVEWFATEFLSSKYYWLLFDGRWLPVVVSPAEEAVLIYDRTDPKLTDVQFSVRAAVGGSIR